MSYPVSTYLGGIGDLELPTQRGSRELSVKKPLMDRSCLIPWPRRILAYQMQILLPIETPHDFQAILQSCQLQVRLTSPCRCLIMVISAMNSKVIHDGIHVWVGGIGGDMASVPFATWDPIFWSHHCMIDRLWWLWQLRHGINNIPSELLDQELSPFPFTVRRVLNIHELGYDYAGSVSTVRGTRGRN